MLICKHDGCEKRASFNYDGQPPKFCASHKKLGMVNRINRFCSCGRKLASLGYPEDRKRVACTDCKKDGMINLSSHRNTCKHENCERVAYFKFDDDIGRQFCVDHKLPGMTSKYHCTMCDKMASYGYYGERCERCAAHREPDMIDLKRAKCACGANARYGYSMSNLTSCHECKDDDMLSIEKLRTLHV